MDWSMDWSFVRHTHRPRRWGSIAASGIAVGLLAGVLHWWFMPASMATCMATCEEEVRSGDRRRGVKTCLESYAQHKDPHDLAWAARGYMYLGEVDEADKLARQLLTGPLFGDGHAILSYLALLRGSGDAARAHATIAFVAHTLTGDERGQASDAVSLSWAAWKVGDFTAALDAADIALTLALRQRDSVKVVAAYMARADMLRRMGDSRGAFQALTSAVERATSPCDRAWTHLKLGMYQMEVQQERLAKRELDAATEANRECASSAVKTSVALNEAWLLRRKTPSASLARLDEIAKSGGELVETLLLRGYLAADRGALEEADHYLEQAESLKAPDADWPWEIARARAELSELRHGPSADSVAESHYRRAIAMIAALRTTARVRSAYFVTSHRGPYDGLIALLARHGRWRDVLSVVLDLDASDMLRATADGSVVRDSVSPDISTPPPSSAAMLPVTVEDVLSAWRTRDLVIVIAPSQRQIGPGHERVYRLRIRDGQVTGEDVDDASMARKWAGALFADPGNEEAARVLGRMILPPGPADSTLHVLAVGALGKVPLAALRDSDGSLSIGRRPLVRVLGLRASGPESCGAAPPIVIADPRGDLPAAKVEGEIVSKALGPGAYVSGSNTSFAATRERLWAARDAALLHIAGHVSELGSWRALRLADGDVAPAEMVQQHLAPRIAVLAGCGSAAALDEEGWGSIAAALLESGTAVVIATDRSVGDDASLSLMHEFYGQPDWRTDPARALARVQQLFAVRAATSTDEAAKPRSWAAFSVLGRPPAVPAHISPDCGLR
jgi:tetratricopeptide (TPR) repeat protein